MQDKPVKLPAGYAPAFAVGITDADGNLAMIGSQTPLPVTNISAAPAANPPAPLAGLATANLLTGPFAPLVGTAVNLTLSGQWAGTVQLLRSVDGGATKHPVTIGGQPWAKYTANACEPAWVETEGSVELYLDIAINSGTLAYRVSQ